jgi:adenylate cyclase
MTDLSASTPVTLRDLERCFEGAVPAVVATASAAGDPNVTYLSRVRMVDDERVALSNQFFSKTARNLAENPRASLLLIDPRTYDEYRLSLVYERTERRGPVFDRLRADVDLVASLHGMADVFHLRAADVYRVLSVEPVPGSGAPPPEPVRSAHRSDVTAVAELAACLGRCPDLPALVEEVVSGLDRVLGHRHALLFLVDDERGRLVTLAGHGYPSEGVGSELALGDGVAGTAARRGEPVRIGNLRQVDKYTRAVRRVADGDPPPDAVEVPVLGAVQSRLAVPALVGGQVVAVLVVESEQNAAYDADDEAALQLLAAVVGQAIEADRAAGEGDRTTGERGDAAPSGPSPAGAPTPSAPDGRGGAHLRFFPADGSTFLDGEYLIKGVAGRLLWSLLRQHAEEGRTDFTNREVRLDPSLELPAYRDNLESRLLLLQRRLDERAAPVRIERTGRGRFRLVVGTRVRLERAGDAGTSSPPLGS